MRWEQLRWARRAFAISWSVGFFVCGPLILLMCALQPRPNSGLALLLFIPTALIGLAAWVTAMASWIIVLMWRCPRCNKRFAITWISSWPWRRECPHCGL